MKFLGWFNFFLSIFMFGTMAYAQDVELEKKILSPLAEQSEGADIRFLDQRIPVITMEQFYSGPARLQGYRVRIFKNGEAFYDGLKNVRTLGQERFNIAPERLQNILSEFKKYKFWSVPEDQLERSPFSVLILEFTLREGMVKKTVRFSGQRHAGMLQSIIENEVNTAQWRCPYTDDRGVDLCASFNAYRDRVVPKFLSVDLPKLLENYR